MRGYKMIPKCSFGALVFVAAAVLKAQAFNNHLCGNGVPCQCDTQILPFPEEITEDFQFEIHNLYTDRQRGARLNIFVKFRYYTPAIVSSYTTESGTFDYQDMKKVVLGFVPAGGMGIPHDTFWEVLNRDLAKAVWAQFPIRGLSIRLEVQGMSSGGIAGHRSSTVTVGNIEPWVSIINNFPKCDGMDTDVGNKACHVTPTWSDGDPESPTLAVIAANKTGTHDNPRTCDTCA
ncbi:hypothetical protein VaNZ11_001625 [Volvox africanus]|uniref:Pherophorin domain-containing protein n=1 Tax=Volvox africanus TaxID=51714 RepID=A0ABQ5RQG0_9CHLO|nr:hypothetical protein VaNZ11_001625 [Volvox africanus]